MLMGSAVPNSVTFGFNAPPLKPDFTMLLMKGAFALLKICCGAEVSEVGCVQLWFSIAITNTVLIGSAVAAAPQTTRFTSANATAQRHARRQYGELDEKLIIVRHCTSSSRR